MSSSHQSKSTSVAAGASCKTLTGQPVPRGTRSRAGTGGRGHGGGVPTRFVRKYTVMIPSKRHSERCRECKIRVQQLLDRIYGACVPDHRFPWKTSLTAHAGTSIDPVLRDVAGGFWRDIGDTASARSSEATCWRAVTTGFPTPDSSSSSMRASTLHAPGSSLFPCTLTRTPWGSPRGAGSISANITRQGTTTLRSATNNEPGTTHCGTSSRRSQACSRQCGSTPATGSGARLIRTAGQTGSASRT